MGLYFPKFEDVFVFRSAAHPQRIVTMVIKDDESVEPPKMMLNDDEYVIDEHGTERTRMTMRVHAQQRAEGSSA